MAEQAKAGPKKAASKSKIKKKPMKNPIKISKQKIQRDNTSENSESAEEDSEEEEQMMYIPKHLRQPKRAVEEPVPVSKPKYGAPAEDPIQALTKMVKDLQIRDKGKEIIYQAGFLPRIGRG